MSSRTRPVNMSWIGVRTVSTPRSKKHYLLTKILFVFFLQKLRMSRVISSKISSFPEDFWVARIPSTKNKKFSRIIFVIVFDWGASLPTIPLQNWTEVRPHWPGTGGKRARNWKWPNNGWQNGRRPFFGESPKTAEKWPANGRIAEIWPFSALPAICPAIFSDSGASPNNGCRPFRQPFFGHSQFRARFPPVAGQRGRKNRKTYTPLFVFSMNFPNTYTYTITLL